MGAAQKQGDICELDLQHPYLRNCKTRTTSSGIDLIATIPSQMPTYKKWKEELQSFTSSFPSQACLLLPTHHKFEDGGVCSTSGQLTLQYEYYPRLLSSEISLRKKESKKFTQGELWYLLYALALVKFHLSQIGQSIGDVHPKNIFLNGTGQIKIASLRSWPGQVNNYRKAILQEQCGYLAPEDIDRLKLGAMDNQVNSQSEMFAIGLVLLTSATLQMQQDLYEMREREFADDIFYSRVGKFQHDTTYSQVFRGVISNLLETVPLKRMNIQELKIFLQKHQDNIMAKKPLRIDNVTKKLQITLKEMFQVIRPQIISEKDASKVALAPIPVPSPPLPPVYASSQKQIIIPIAEQSTIQTNVKQSIRNSNIKNVINYEQRRPSSQSRIQLPPNNPPPQKITNITKMPQIPLSNNYFNGLPPSIPVSINPNSNEQPHRPVISKVFSSSSSFANSMVKRCQPFQMQSPKYKPFQSISVSRQRESPFRKDQLKELLVVNLPIQNNAIKQTNIVQAKRSQQKQVLTPNTQLQIRSQPFIGQNNNLSKDTTVQLFQHNCLINPNYQPECVDIMPSNSSSLGPQTVQQAVEEQQQQESKIQQLQAQEENISQISNKDSPIQELLMRSRNTQNRSSLNHSLLKSKSKLYQHTNSLPQKNESKSQLQPEKSLSLAQQQQQLEETIEQIKVKQAELAEEQVKLNKKPQERKLQFEQSNEVKRQLQPIHYKSQLDLQTIANKQTHQVLETNGEHWQEQRRHNQVIISLPQEIKQQVKAQTTEFTNKSLSPTVKIWGAKPTLKNTVTHNTTNIKEIQTNSQKISDKSVSGVSIKQSEKGSTQTIQKIIESELVQNKFCFQSKSPQQIQNPDVPNQGVLLATSKEENIVNNKEGVNNNYILIEQDSRHTGQHFNQSQQQRQGILQQESEVINYHTYAEVVTDGHFQECWQQILIFLKDPTEYSTILDPEKVKIRIQENNWSLKIGPAIFDIFLNKQEGKFLLRNCGQESSCEGEMLGGVYKDQEKRHRLWFNSAYYYRGKKIPSRQLIEESLKLCKINIDRQKK